MANIRYNLIIACCKEKVKAKMRDNRILAKVRNDNHAKAYFGRCRNRSLFFSTPFSTLKLHDALKHPILIQYIQSNRRHILGRHWYFLHYPLPRKKICAASQIGGEKLCAAFV